MNGRMYDPRLGRFLSPDPFVQAPDYSQSFNRYSYVWNNPMKYTDPDGEFVWMVPVLVGAIIGGYSGYKIGKAKGAEGWNMAGYVFGGAVIGGVAGYTGFAVGAKVAAATLAGGSTAMGSSIAAGLMGCMVSGGINGAGFTALSEGSATDIIVNMIQGAVAGGFAGAAGGAAFQGMNSLLNKTFTHQFGRLTVSGQPLKMLPINSLSYMAGSTASQMTANIVNGRNPFKGVDYGFNLGLLYPLSMDVMRYSNHYNTHVARKHMPNEEIVSVRKGTNIMPNGDLSLDQSIGVREYYDDFKMEIGPDHTGMLRPYPRFHDFRHTMVPGYQWQIFSIFHTLSLKRK
jgi:hypothetical protein